MSATRGYFITGTDTGVGKTVATCALLRGAARKGWRAAGMKPVAAGFGPAEKIHEDVMRIAAAMNVPAPREIINPCLLPEAIAPHLAAAHASMVIELPPIQAAYRQLAQQAELVFVEGAGGFLVPFGDFDSADLAAALQLSGILVVGMRLGCLNHALLTANAMQLRGVPLVGWIANCIDPGMRCLEENLEFLAARLPAPLLGVVPYCADPYAETAHSDLDLMLLK